jgi:dUTP pyrophosphatase
MTQPTIEIQAEEGSELPTYGTEQAAGADVRARLPEPVTLQPGERKIIPTGLRISIEKGYEVQVRPRSGLAAKHGLTVLNTPGTIDSDYRGEIKVILINLGQEAFTIETGMRIAQLVIAPALQANFIQAEALSSTARGEGGFGHTGIH